MAINPFRKGGDDTIPLSEGGTGATDAATALSNIGGIDTAAHSTLNHAGIPGVGDLTTAAHSSLDHTGIPGASLSLRQRLLTPTGYQSSVWLPNPDVSSNVDWLTSSSLFGKPVQTVAGGAGVPVFGSGLFGAFIQSDGATGSHLSESNVPVAKEELPRFVAKMSVSFAGAPNNNDVNVTAGIRSPGVAFGASAEAIGFESVIVAEVVGTIKLQRRIASATITVDTGITPANDVVHYFVIEWTGADAVTCTIYDTAFAVLFTTSFVGAAAVPQLTNQRAFVDHVNTGTGNNKTFRFYMSLLDRAA